MGIGVEYNSQDMQSSRTVFPSFNLGGGGGGTLGISSHGESFAKRSRKSARILVLQLLLIPTANQIVLHCPKGQSALQQHRREQGG